MPKILIASLLALCIALPSRPAYAGPIWDCVKSWKRFSLRAFLGVSFVTAVGLAWYANEKRAREAFRKFRFAEGVIPSLDALMTDKKALTQEAHAQAFAGFSDRYRVRALQKIVKGDPELQKLAEKLGVNWDRLEARADKYIMDFAANYSHVREAGLAAQAADELAYGHLSEMKQMGALYEALLKKHAQPGLRLFSAHQELERLAQVESLYNNAYPPQTTATVRLRSYCEDNKIEPRELLQEIRNYSPETAAALSNSDIEEELHEMSDTFRIRPPNVAPPDKAISDALKIISSDLTGDPSNQGYIYEIAVSHLVEKILSRRKE